MSAMLDILLADRDRAEPVMGPCTAIPLISDAQCDAVDDTILYAEDMRNTLVRAEFVARQRRFESRFGELA